MPYIGNRFCNECTHFNGTEICDKNLRVIVDEVILVVAYCEFFIPLNSSTQHFIPHTELPKENKMPKIKVKKYTSKDGFELIPLRRGFTEIIPIWEILEDAIQYTKSDCFICGGYARYCASPKYKPAPANDVDIYCQSEKAYNKLKRILDSKISVKTENSMAVSYDRPPTGEFHYMPPIQLIKPVNQGKIVAVGKKTTVLSNFDFTIIRAAIESPVTALVDADFKHDEIGNILRLKNIHHPLSSLLRCFKYTSKGYWLVPTEATKLFEEWNDIKFESKSKLLGYVEQIRSGKILDEKEHTAFYNLFRGRVL